MWCAMSNIYLWYWCFNLHIASEHARFKVKTGEAMWQCWLRYKPWASHNLLMKQNGQHWSILLQHFGDHILNSRRYQNVLITPFYLFLLKNGFSVILAICLLTTFHEKRAKHSISEVECEILYGHKLKWVGQFILKLSLNKSNHR